MTLKSEEGKGSEKERRKVTRRKGRNGKWKGNLERGREER